MIEDEEVSRAKRFERPVLDSLSVADLRDYISELRAEILRAEAAIAGRDNARGHAERFFKR